MDYKARVLTYSPQKKMKQISEIIKNSFDIPNDRVDVIPPAYSCDKERIVFLCISAKKVLPDDIRRFLFELDKTKSSNIALVVEGNAEAADMIKSTLKQTDPKKNAQIFDEVFMVKGSFLAFAGSLSDEETTALNEWIGKIKAIMA